MRKLTKHHIEKMDAWMQLHARPYDRAKWNHLFHNAGKEEIVSEMLKYQNADGGFGNGFESDLLSPLSAAIPTAEAIFQSYDYDLDRYSPWFQKALSYFEHSVQDIPKYWEDFPKEAMEEPHAPWWNYAPSTSFSPNPCAAVASAFIRYGTDTQRELGLQIAKDCFALLTGTAFCGDHDTLNLLTLVEQLFAIHSPLITEEILSAAQRRIAENVCYDSGKWNEYYFQPLDIVDSPASMWYSDVEQGIEQNIDFWLDTIQPEGVWIPNFSWGSDTEVAKQVTENWKGYIAVKRARILLNFNRVEL